jgi:hypothetical protein
MMTHEPVCVQWKRRDTACVSEQLSDLRAEQELVFGQKQTEQLKLFQAETKQRLTNHSI